MMRRVLIADDDALSRDFLSEFLRSKGIDVRATSNANDAFRALCEDEFDLVISDLRMPGDDGITLLRRIRRSGREMPVVMITAYGSVDTAVRALKEGARDFLTKPLSPEQVEEVLESVSQPVGDLPSVVSLPCQDGAKRHRIVGGSFLMRDLIDTAIRVARSRATVLITGESGTGKELFARLIHEESPRRDKPYVKVNCAALAESLLESELFGHEKGAFTGAVQRRLGRFELAEGGTLFLDEIGETSPALQAKLLRILEVREFERVGGSKTLSADVRVVAATNRDLEAEIQKGNFREDLFYRLQVVNLRIPALRERRDDIEPLARHFLDKYTEENGCGSKRLAADAVESLLSYDWPGNVRELEHMLERAVVLDQGDDIGVDELLLPASRRADGGLDVSNHVGCTLENVERALILKTLESTNNSRKEAAKILGVTSRTLTNKISKYRKLGIEVGDPVRTRSEAAAIGRDK